MADGDISSDRVNSEMTAHVILLQNMATQLDDNTTFNKDMET